MAKKISVLLVDDHSLVRRGFRRMLEDEPDMTVVGEAGDGEKAIELARELHPKVIVMDCALPGMNGLEATRRILDDSPEIGVLMLSMHSESTWVRQAVDAGGLVVGRGVQSSAEFLERQRSIGLSRLGSCQNGHVLQERSSGVAV